MRRREANCFTVTHGVDEIAAPPAETRDGCPNWRAGHAVHDRFEIITRASVKA